MRKVIVPKAAMILSQGKCNVGDLCPGDSVTGYDPRALRVRFGVIRTINQVTDTYRILITAEGFRLISITPKTIMHTPRGDLTMDVAGLNPIYGYCQVKPKLLIKRNPISMQEIFEDRDAVELTWYGPPYIWLNGILVGAEA